MARSKLLDLIDLAQENSSTKRRELLREMTDLFLPSSSSRVYFEISQNVSLTNVMSPRTLVVARMAD